MSVKYSYQYSHGHGPQLFQELHRSLSGRSGPDQRPPVCHQRHAHFQSDLVAEYDLGFTRGVWHIDAYNPHGVYDPLGTLGFPSYLQSNGFKGCPRFFSIPMHHSAGYPNMGTDPYGNYRLGQDTGQLAATLDKVHGQHEFKFGFDGRIHQMNYIQTNAPVGILQLRRERFAACPAADPNYGNQEFATAAAIPWPAS